jgi:radical SAM protein with 4Fe4S-binding SPASM domain
VFATNGSLLSGDILDALCEYLTPKDRVIFSVEGNDKDTYEGIRRGLSWNTLMTNIALFQKKKPVGVESCARLTILPEAKPDREFWSKRVDMVSVVPEVPFGREVKGHYEHNYDSTDCIQAHTYFVVTENGDVIICCGGDVQGKKYAVGNIYRDGIRQIWEGPELASRRTHAHVLCRTCNRQWVNECR